MTNTDKGAGGGGGAPSNKLKETEKKKRYRVKQLLGDIKKQVEFWFGDANLHKDRFLRKIIDESDDGYVDISVLTGFNRMKKLTTDPKLISRALKNSTVVEVNLEGNKVRRQQPLGDSPINIDSCTVYVELLPKDVSHSWIEKVFSKCGNVTYVSIPRYRTTGDSKGFAFVEFENEEQAQKAIEMLNNPPEDAPRKPGIFPKTLNRKPIPITGDEEEKKKRKKKKKDASTAETPAGEVKEMETEAPQPKKKHSAIEDSDKKVANPEKEQGKVSEKKRRRSQTAEEAESEVPSKMRKTSCSDSGEKEKEKSDSAAEGDDEKGNENGDDSAVKAKRKRKKKYKEKLKIEEEVIPLRVLSKKEWLQLKQQYLALQKSSMSSLKKCLKKIDDKEQGSAKDRSVEIKKENNQSPQFISGVIMKITDSKPLPARKIVKETLSEVSQVAYVDILDGDSEGYVRFLTPEGAKAVCKAKAKLQKEHSWKLEILRGDHEQRYWHKILVDRQVKLNRPREKKRGKEKLIAKAEKIIMARAKEANKHIRFGED